MILYAFEKQHFFFSKPGRISLKDDETVGDGRSTRFRVPITLLSPLYLVPHTHGSQLQSNVTSSRKPSPDWLSLEAPS